MSLVEVSVIVPVYNVEKYIATCIQSILMQTFENYELLVINDGSTDSSIDIAKTFNDERIQIFEKENGGLSDARNYGLERAKGKFIYFIDPDDWIEPSLLKDNLDIIIQNNLEFIVFGFQKEYQDLSGTLIKSEQVLPAIDSYNKGSCEQMIDEYHLSILGYAWNKIYRKSFLDKHQVVFPKGVSLVEDIIYNSSLFTVSDKIQFNRNCYYHYMHRPAFTLTGKYHDKAFEWLLLKIDSIKEFLTSWNLPIDKIDQLIAAVYIQGLRFILDKLYASKNPDPVHIYGLLTSEHTLSMIKKYRAITLKDIVFKLLIKYRFVSILNVLKGRYSS